MSVLRFQAELEHDLAWRLAELRQLNTFASEAASSSEADMRRRPAVVFLYAHFEGFLKFAFQAYVTFLNREGLLCGEANVVLAATSAKNVFNDLCNADRRPNQWRRLVGDDSQLAKLARQSEFLSEIDGFERRPMRIEEDAIDLESNVGGDVLRRNLFRLGLPHGLVDRFAGTIQRLLNTRNDIAHGTRRRGLTASEFDELFESVKDVMQGVRAELSSAMVRGSHKRHEDDLEAKMLGLHWFC